MINLEIKTLKVYFSYLSQSIERKRKRLRDDDLRVKIINKIFLGIQINIEPFHDVIFIKIKTMTTVNFVTALPLETANVCKLRKIYSLRGYEERSELSLIL